MENQLTEVQATGIVSHAESRETFWELFKRLVKQSWTFYKAHFKQIALVGVPYAFLILISGKEPDIFSFIAFIVYILFYITFTAYVIHEGARDMKGSFKESISKFFPLAWLTIFSFLTVMGGLLLLAVPGIYMMLIVSFVFYIFFKENIHGREAIVRAWGYVQGRWWKTLGLALIVAIALELVGSIFRMGEEMNNVFSALYGVLVSLPLSIIFSYYLYKHLVATAGASAHEEQLTRTKRVTILAILGLVAGAFALAAGAWTLIHFFPDLRGQL